MELRELVSDEADIRDMSYRVTKEYIRDLLAPLKDEIVQVSVERETAIEEVMKAFVHYTAALQDGVNIVSGS